MSVTALGRAVNLSQSALSQHLAKLRAQRVVTTRRERQALFYRIADGRIRQLLSALYGIYPASSDSPKPLLFAADPQWTCRYLCSLATDLRHIKPRHLTNRRMHEGPPSMGGGPPIALLNVAA